MVCSGSNKRPFPARWLFVNRPLVILVDCSIVVDVIAVIVKKSVVVIVILVVAQV